MKSIEIFIINEDGKESKPKKIGEAPDYREAQALASGFVTGLGFVTDVYNLPAIQVRAQWGCASWRPQRNDDK